MINKGFKLTNQSVIILDCVSRNYDYPCVQDVFDFVKNKFSRITKKTIYRNLQFLVEKGLITEVKSEGVQRYEPKLEPHLHCIFRACEKIIEVQSGEFLMHVM
jgi:Fur family transcriptional regulator, ferric uptake regulator